MRLERRACSEAGECSGLLGPTLHGCVLRVPAATGGCATARKPRAQTGRGGWCERLGPLPERWGWNTMSRARAGGRAGGRARARTA